jgi:AcrR family transcriptional regulator
MSSAADNDLPRPGLRERKKARTQATIQATALKLFGQKGYDETTIDEIAEAAEVSPSTFFRYFPTKEDVVLFDLNDELIIEAFRAQPSELTAVQALRNAIRSVVGELTPEQIELDRQRQALTFANPELRARMWDEIARMIDLFAKIGAERVGRSPDDFELRVFAGALLGVAFSVMLADPDAPLEEMMERYDSALQKLEKGLTL